MTSINNNFTSSFINNNKISIINAYDEKEIYNSDTMNDTQNDKNENIYIDDNIGIVLKKINTLLYVKQYQKILLHLLQIIL